MTLFAFAANRRDAVNMDPEFHIKDAQMRRAAIDRHRLSAGPTAANPLHSAAVFENTYFSFFQISKIHDFLRFFKMTYQKVVKSHQQRFSPQYVTKE